MNALNVCLLMLSVIFIKNIEALDVLITRKSDGDEISLMTQTCLPCPRHSKCLTYKTDRCCTLCKCQDLGTFVVLDAKRLQGRCLSRHKGDCDYYIEDHAEHKPSIPIFDQSQSRKVGVIVDKNNKYMGWKKCSIDNVQSYENGKWTYGVDKSFFYIQQSSKTELYLKEGSTLDRKRGYILKVSIQCQDEDTECVIFKVSGGQIYIISKDRIEIVPAKNSLSTTESTLKTTLKTKTLTTKQVTNPQVTTSRSITPLVTSKATKKTVKTAQIYHTTTDSEIFSTTRPQTTYRRITNEDKSTVINTHTTVKITSQSLSSKKIFTSSYLTTKEKTHKTFSKPRTFITLERRRDHTTRSKSPLVKSHKKKEIKTLDIAIITIVVMAVLVASVVTTYLLIRRYRITCLKEPEVAQTCYQNKKNSQTELIDTRRSVNRKLQKRPTSYFNTTATDDYDQLTTTNQVENIDIYHNLTKRNQKSNPYVDPESLNGIEIIRAKQKKTKAHKTIENSLHEERKPPNMDELLKTKNGVDENYYSKTQNRPNSSMDKHEASNDTCKVIDENYYSTTNSLPKVTTQANVNPAKHYYRTLEENYYSTADNDQSKVIYREIYGDNEYACSQSYTPLQQNDSFIDMSYGELQKGQPRKFNKK